MNVAAVSAVVVAIVRAGELVNVLQMVGAVLLGVADGDFVRSC